MSDKRYYQTAVFVGRYEEHTGFFPDYQWVASIRLHPIGDGDLDVVLAHGETRHDALNNLANTVAQLHHKAEVAQAALDLFYEGES